MRKPKIDPLKSEYQNEIENNEAYFNEVLKRVRPDIWTLMDLIDTQKMDITKTGAQLVQELNTKIEDWRQKELDERDFDKNLDEAVAKNEEISRIEDILTEQNLTLDAALEARGETKASLIEQIRLQKIIGGHETPPSFV